MEKILTFAFFSLVFIQVYGWFLLIKNWITYHMLKKKELDDLKVYKELTDKIYLGCYFMLGSSIGLFIVRGFMGI